ncbi:hypothetical protein [Oceanidesulfovibrio marinus]|uniref:Uncharacterized protein n=1 Tax=Oceanidesulfovibrio marinus TaxID=370038 RepID=A0A6P1ZBZ8_9BACT|nr:hypothetical protein [Oceanidesulfovibrio marinus]TVM31606.1 hypothetical protein DQK91_18255 [Oceanidesulfovibrio marinus]
MAITKKDLAADMIIFSKMTLKQKENYLQKEYKMVFANSRKLSSSVKKASEAHRNALRVMVVRQLMED